MESKTYRQICEGKWEELRRIIPEIMKDIEDNDDTRERKAGELTSFKWVLTREKEYELTVLIEYDRKYHDTGIYYGCRIENAKECSDNK